MKWAGFISAVILYMVMIGFFTDTINLVESKHYSHPVQLEAVASFSVDAGIDTELSVE